MHLQIYKNMNNDEISKECLQSYPSTWIIPPQPGGPSVRALAVAWLPCTAQDTHLSCTVCPLPSGDRHTTAFHPEFTLTQIWRLKALILRLIRSVELAFRVFWSHEHHTKKPPGRAAEFWLRASCTSALFMSQALSSSASCRSHHLSLWVQWAQEPAWGRSEPAQQIPHLQLQLSHGEAVTVAQIRCPIEIMPHLHYF